MQAAFTKKPMKPRRTPCFFSNRSLYLVRASMTADMSTSLKVVRIAALFCASLRRLATVWRRRVILTRSWPRPGPVTAAAGPVLGATLAGAGAEPDAIAAITSSLVRRPSLPVPVMRLGSRPCSSTMRRTAGERVIDPASACSGTAAAAGVGAAAGAGAGAGAGAETTGVGAAAAGAALAARRRSRSSRSPRRH